MVLRMEDTDKGRSKKEFEEDIIAGLKWLGIEWEGEIWRQSERVEVYKKYLKKLLDKGLAYEAEENKDKSGHVIRFKNPNGKVSFEDTLRGTISVDVSDLQDFVIARSINDPLYHLTVVIDDYESGVTHIIRGEDGLANTPRQILLQQALGFTTPKYTHIPFILGPDKSKLSKRHGAKSVLEYKDAGYLPEAVVNFLAMLGWRSKNDDEKEIWTLNELLEEFDEKGFQKSPAVFNEDKLKWINKQHLQAVSDEYFWESLIDFASDKLKNKLEESGVKEALLQDLRERISVYSDIEQMEKEGDFNWLLKDKLYLASEELIWKKSDQKETLEHLKKLSKILCDSKIEDFSKDGVESLILPYAEEKGKGNVLWPLRYALSGDKRSPSPFVLAAALGQNETCKRIHQAINVLEK